MSLYLPSKPVSLGSLVSFSSANKFQANEVGKDRRSDSAAPFPGRSRILEEIANGPKRRRVGLQITGSPAREGSKIFDGAGEKEIGTSPLFDQSPVYLCVLIGFRYHYIWDSVAHAWR